MYDYVIVGAGSAGCVLANRLSADPTNQVLLLEAGSRDTSPFIHMPAGIVQLLATKNFNWAFNTAEEPNLDNRRLYWPRGKGLGGSSSINGMIYIRGHAQDYDHWGQLGNEGWSFEELLPYFKRSINNERGQDEYHGVGGPLNVMDQHSKLQSHEQFIQAGVEAGYPFNDDFNGVQQEGVGPYQLTKFGKQRCSAARAFLTPILDRDNLTVMTEARSLRINFEGKRAQGVTYLKDGEQHEVTATRETIICAGAVQSPQLLQLSGVGNPEDLGSVGIDCVHPLSGVGQNLQDHLDVIVQRYCTDASLSLARFTTLPQMVLTLMRYLLFKSGPAIETPVVAGAFLRSREDLDIPDLQLHFVPAIMVDHGRKKVRKPGFSIHVCQLRPESRGEIRLASADPLDEPVIKANYLSVPSDLDTLVSGVKVARRIFDTESFRSILGEEFKASRDAKTDDDIENFVRQHAETIYHPVGTCKMGHDDMAVVNARLRVRGLESLRVVDASVMPTLIGGNTNAPTIMIAEKASDMILEDNGVIG